jgi:hypothetical protein
VKVAGLRLGGDGECQKFLHPEKIDVVGRNEMPADGEQVPGHRPGNYRTVCNNNKILSVNYKLKPCVVLLIFSSAKFDKQMAAQHYDFENADRLFWNGLKPCVVLKGVKAMVPDFL